MHLGREEEGEDNGEGEGEGEDNGEGEGEDNGEGEGEGERLTVMWHKCSTHTHQHTTLMKLSTCIHAPPHTQAHTLSRHVL